MLRKMTLSSFLFTIGFVLHLITPSIMGGMKPDFMLLVMCILMIFCDSVEEALLIGFVAGFLSGITSLMPLGFFSNLFDKVIIAPITYMFSRKYFKDWMLVFITTILSGSIFILLNIPLLGLSFRESRLLFMMHVFPTSLINVFLYRVYLQVKVRLPKIKKL